MYINRLFIKNFRCFGSEGIEIDLNDGLTAFIGKNGSGKTAVLEAMNYLLGQDYLPSKISEKDFHNEANGLTEEDAITIIGVTGKPFFYDIDIINDRGSAATVVVPCNEIILKIKRRQKAERVLDEPYIVTKTVKPISGDIPPELFKDYIFKKSSYPIDSLSTELQEISDLETAKEIIRELQKGRSTRIESTDGYYSVAYTLKGGKEVRNASFPTFSLSFNQIRAKGIPKAYYLSKDRSEDVVDKYSLIGKVLTNLHWKYIRSKAKGKALTIFDEYSALAKSLRDAVDEKGILINRINDKVQEICSIDPDYSLDFLDLDQPYKHAFLSKNQGEKMLSASNLGSGYNILIAYALFSYVAEEEKNPIIFIIDEPELHLHSDWQRKIYGTFSKQNAIQIVYSTHSEKLISLGDWKEIRLLKDCARFPKPVRLKEEITSTQNGRTYTRREFLEDYAKRFLHISTVHQENLELFYSDKVVLVEGPVEEYSLPILLERIGCNISKYSVSIIPVWGKNKMKEYQMLCKCFDINYFTIFDHDEDEEENEPIMNDLNSDRYFMFSTNFENKLGIGGDGKFNKVVRKIESLTASDSLDPEIEECLRRLKKFIIT